MLQTTDTFVAVVLGLCSHGLAVARALAAAGVPVRAVEKDMQLPGVGTAAVHKVHQVRDFSAENLLPELLALRKELPAQAQVVLFPINDDHVRLIGKHLNALTPDFLVSWAPCAELVLKLLNKDALEAYCRDRGIDYPASLVFHAATAVARGTAGLRFPLIIKPVRPLSSFKALIADDAAHLDRLLNRYQSDLPILAQDYIAGDDRSLYFVALMLQDGQALHAAVGRKLASFPPAMGQTTVAETAHADAAMDIAHRFFAGTGLSGPASLELKLDEAGRYWVIEPTVGRTDFWAALFIDAGFNLPLMEFQLASGQTVVRPDRLLDCVWYDTERAPLAYAGLVCATLSTRPLGKRQVFTYLHRHDWQPFMRACWSFLGRSTRRLLGLRAAAPPAATQPARSVRP